MTALAAHRRLSISNPRALANFPSADLIGTQDTKKRATLSATVLTCKRERQ